MTELNTYIDLINRRYKTGISREHSYRGDLQNLLGSLAPDVLVTNEPARVACGAPDYILTKRDIPIGYIEAKDVGKSLDSKNYKEQFDRYRKSLDNLIITDYLDFWLYIDGEFVTSIKIAEIVNGAIVPSLENFDHFVDLIKDFCTHVGQTIKSASKLSKMMAGKAKMLSQVIEGALTSDEENQEDSTLKEQMNAFKQILIHDIKPKEFADIYAQTIAYGMFAARLHDPTLDDFSRQEAAELIPKSNPFLRKLFQYIAGYDLDDRIKWIVDSLADIFRATDVAALLKNFGKTTQKHDPIIHFYETFLAEYDPKLRKSRGVWYTPEPVVNFIVRAVDDILKTEFGLPQGLADTSKTTIELDTQTLDKRFKARYKRIEKEVHKVQILDPAAGTGTFLAEVVKHIYKRFEGQQGIWSSYVENHLIPRLNGFELLMASYAMAHLKLDMLLQETGYKPKKDQRFRVYLTNSLEEHHPDTGTLFASWLSNEASEANYIKRDTPVMVILGNPPYSGHSSNEGEWVEKLIDDYKKEPSGGKLKEQNSKWLNDDYVKFIRYSQWFIDKNKEGVLAFITNNGYLDNPTFRGMRFNLLNSFNKIYCIDLHGSSKKQEKAGDGTPDKNVFDIQQGVSIIVAIKKKVGEKTCSIKSFDLLGNREYKYKFLFKNSIDTIKFQEFSPYKPYYLFKYTDEKLFKIYEKGFNVIEVFPVNVMGFQTHRDHFAVTWHKDEIHDRAIDLLNKDMSDEFIYNKYNIKDNRDWQLNKARLEVQNDPKWAEKITRCNYRPFDNRFCYFSDVMMDYPRRELMQHSLNKNNLLFGVGRQGMAVGDIQWCLTTISKQPVDANVFRRGGVNLCPLYLYPESTAQQTLDGKQERKPNLNMEIVNKIAVKIGLAFTTEKEEREGTFAPIDILDYIYAVLHSPAYREKYKEFLKIDFPRVPYPKDTVSFWRLVKLGGKLRGIHLLESPKVEQFITTYPHDGDNIVTRKIGKKDFQIIDEEKALGRIWINDTQYFDNLPIIAWEFYIGGYQPAQKWLKDRKERTLTFEDILHYQKIIVALTETDRIMKEIDELKKI